MISINAVDRLPVRRLLEAFPQIGFSWLFRTKSPLDDDDDDDDTSEATIYTSDERVEWITNGLIILVGLVMLLAPLWWLEYVSNKEGKLKIITLFVCLFISMMMAANINKPFEVVAATAVYSAVLMVFAQID